MLSVETAAAPRTPRNSDEAKWDAVKRRDSSADGKFTYSVRTTGVYCKPSCAARPALRENVRFHASCAAAERAGFRACKRCRPNEKPTAIRFAMRDSALGPVAIAASEKGVCAIVFGDGTEALTRDLQTRFPKTRLTPGGKEFERLSGKVVRFVENPRRGPDFPLDMGGTEFQQKVWRALRKIPAGSTTNYAAIAKAIGKPQAVRAVAQACAANRLAVAVPCHRVVRSDGSLSGYRWGAARKRTLLAREAGA